MPRQGVVEIHLHVIHADGPDRTGDLLPGRQRKRPNLADFGGFGEFMPSQSVDVVGIPKTEGLAGGEFRCLG
jgi:hypothetical protein